MGRQSEVVVGAEVEHLTSIFELDHGVLHRSDDPLLLEQAILFNRLQLPPEVILH